MNRISCRNIFLIISVLVLVFSFSFITVSYASESYSQINILLGFKDKYGPENKTHYGIDVYVRKGKEIYSPIDGIISFSGKIPGSAGLNVIALTITNDLGHQVSINPFSDISFEHGDVIKKGQLLGKISDIGDPSSAETHFHLSLREKGIYKDPTHLLIGVISDSPNNYVLNNRDLKQNNGISNKPLENFKELTKPKIETNSLESTNARKELNVKEKVYSSKNIYEENSTRSIDFGSESKSAYDSIFKDNKEGYKSSASGKAHQNTKSSVKGSVNFYNQKQGGKTILTRNEDKNLSREVKNLFSSLSKNQLMAVFSLLFIVISAFGLGLWRLVQLIGLNESISKVKENLALALERKIKKEM